jgi:hypothetical protein
MNKKERVQIQRSKLGAIGRSQTDKKGVTPSSQNTNPKASTLVQHESLVWFV